MSSSIFTSSSSSSAFSSFWQALSCNIFYSFEIAKPVGREKEKKKLICSLVHLYCYYTNAQRRRHSLVLACLMLIYALYLYKQKEKKSRSFIYFFFLIDFITTTFSSPYGINSFFYNAMACHDSHTKTLLFFLFSLSLSDSHYCRVRRRNWE